MKNLHTHNDIQFHYSPRHRKWIFFGKQVNGRNYTLVTPINKGAESLSYARRVAGIVAGSLKRGYTDAMDGLDNMSRGQLNKLIGTN